MRIGISLGLLGAAIIVIVLKGDTEAVLADAKRLSLSVLGAVLVALLANGMAAALRLKVIASDIGYPITLRHAMAAVSGGNLAGAAFFQIAGQLMARGFIMAKGGVPFAPVTVMTLYERLVAAAISGLMALAGAYFIFGHVYLDRAAGGNQLIKIGCGIIGAATAGFLGGYGRLAARKIAPLITRTSALQFTRVVGLSILVQLPMMAAYVVATLALVPQVPVADLIAASAIVMFTASIPISLAGWGVREMSAIFALGTIGVDVGNSVLAAVVVGAGSMLAMALMAAVSLPRAHHTGHKAEYGLRPLLCRPATSCGDALAWGLPPAAATLVLFQVYIPMASGTLLNVNLADPLAILAASLFLLGCIQRGRLPAWRFGWLNLAIVAATLVLALSLTIGAARFGWTEWAVVNRFLGWFMLLVFAGTGAFIVKQGYGIAFRALLLTYATAVVAVVALDLIHVSLSRVELNFLGSIDPRAISGFSQNRNFFAFQILMAIAAAIVAMDSGPKVRIAILSVMMAGLFFSGSRSGWIALVFVLGTGIYVRATSVSEVACSIIGAAVLIAGVMPLGGDNLPPIVPTEASNNERLVSMIGGLRLFVESPIFGAGLGAFRNQQIPAASGIPLLIHSTTIWLLAELGIVGFLAFAIPAVRLLVVEIPRAHGDAASKLIVICMVAFAVMSGPADMLYQRTFWLLMGAALAMPFNPAGSLHGSPS